MKLLQFNYEHLRQMVEHDPRTQTMVPIMRSRMQALMETLLKPYEQRKGKEEVSDDYIRGRIAELRSLITLPEDLISEYDARNRQDEQIKARDERDAQADRVIAAQGRSGPDAVRPPISDDEATPLGSEGGNQ